MFDDTTYPLVPTVEPPSVNFPGEVAVFEQDGRDVAAGLDHLQDSLTTLPDTSLPPDEWAVQFIDGHGFEAFFPSL